MELAVELSAPLVRFSSSGGARMQEGVIALMQMAKVLTLLDQLADSALPYISVMTDPCYGGVTASFAMLGDVNIAEPGAFIGFAGPRVIEQTTREKLPPDAAKAEFLLHHGMLDLVTPRADMRGVLARLLEIYGSANRQATVTAANDFVIDKEARHELRIQSLNLLSEHWMTKLNISENRMATPHESRHGS